MTSFWKTNLQETTTILRYLGEDKLPKEIGKGEYAKVYWLKGDRKRILKVTVDKSDAQACMHVLRHPKQHLLNVSDVFKINHDAYGIVAEKCTPLSHAEAMLMDQLTSWEEDSPDPLANYAEGLTVGWVDWFEGYLEDEGYRVDPMVFNQYRIWAREFESLDIVFWDLHSGNVMSRGRDSVIVDLGYSDPPPIHIPNLGDLLKQKESK